MTVQMPLSYVADTAPGAELLAKAETLGQRFAARAQQADEEDRFVAENYRDLKEAGLAAAAVPKELGGGGASIPDLAEMLRILAHHCSSTALAFSMHTHQVAIPAWRWTVQKTAAVEPLLKRVAAENLILLSSGGSDWIPGSGRAERVAGGGRAELDAYLGFLRGGCSRWSLELLRDAGVDLERPEPVATALARFAALVDELEATLAD